MIVFPVPLPERVPVLVAGAGGGFDFLCGLPIALELEGRGHPVVLASYSFTDLDRLEGVRREDGLVEVDAGSVRPDSDYFPEGHLCRWFLERRGEARSVWCLPRRGVRPTRTAYERLVERSGAGAVIAVDGGVDGLFRGDEHDLATPSMDAISVFAAALAPAPVRLYATTAFGVEGAESEVSHAQALRRMAELAGQDAFLGAGALVRRAPACAAFLDAIDFVGARMDPVRRSIVLASMRAAVHGHFGRTDVHPKTRERQPWISPLTALYWYFDAGAVAAAKIFRADCLESETVDEVARAIETARARRAPEPFEAIPI